MAYKQPITVPNNKQYALISNFNKGFNTNTADGVINDNTFRDMLNMSEDENGKLKKRNGHKFSDIQTLLDYTMGYNYQWNENEWNGDLYSGTINGVAGGDRETLIDELIYMKGHEGISETGDNRFGTNYDKVLGTFILKDTLLDIANFEEENSLNYLSEHPTLEFVCILGGHCHGEGAFLGGYTYSTFDVPTFKYVYVKIRKLNYYASAVAQDVSVWEVTFDIKYETEIPENMNYRVAQEIYDNGKIDLVQFNNDIYFTTGYNLYKIKYVASTTNNPSYTLETISASTVYKPTAIEATNVGFNILAETPIEWYENTGTADAIRGIFFTMNVNATGDASYEPIQTVPINKTFRINVIHTGTGALGVPYYRADNGDTDETSNPWIAMTGAYGNGTNYATNIFLVTSFNFDGKYEIKITKGEISPYRGYFTTGNPTVPETGRISETQNLIQSSLYCKIIGSQLVLYGGHGYVFFSDYGNFTYFPNYNFIYVTETADDTVVSINYFRQYYAIFTRKILKKMVGTFGANDFAVGKLNDFVGCINPNTIKQVQNNIIFLSDDGLYVLKQGYTGEGTENVQRIDISIEGSYIPTDAINAYVLNNNYILTFEDKAIIYNFVQDAFYKYEYGVSQITGNDTTYTQILDNQNDLTRPLIGSVIVGLPIIESYKTYKKAIIKAEVDYLIRAGALPEYGGYPAPLNPEDAAAVTLIGTNAYAAINAVTSNRDTIDSIVTNAQTALEDYHNVDYSPS